VPWPGSGKPDAWGAVDERDHAIAYLLTDLVDGCAHIEQVSVASAHAGRGIGATLIDHLARTTSAQKIPALTLTAFRDVAWNAPYYARLGFEVIEPADQGPEMRDLIEPRRAPGRNERLPYSPRDQRIHGSMRRGHRPHSEPPARR
jgi:N-acetylglutamate synthase-like GNAT family acetyltransferase